MSAPHTPKRIRATACPRCGNEDLEREDNPADGVQCLECGHAWVEPIASGQRAPGPMRKPGKRELRGLSEIRNEMDTAAHDMRSYRNPDEKKRADDIFAGLHWIDAAIANATRSTS